MGVEAQYEKGFCLMLTLFSHINARISSRPHSILRTSSDTLIVLSRARLDSLLWQDLTNSGGPGFRHNRFSWAGLFSSSPSAWAEAGTLPVSNPGVSSRKQAML